MTIDTLFKQIILNSVGASLDKAGEAFSAGAWPIVKQALTPVLNRLSVRLGNAATPFSKEEAEQAQAIFDADGHLREIFRTGLLRELEIATQSGARLTDDTRLLLRMLYADSAAENATPPSPETDQRFTRSLLQQTSICNAVRAIAWREMGPLTELLSRQLSRLKIGVGAMMTSGGQPEQTLNHLQVAIRLVAHLLDDAPTDVHLQMHLAKIYQLSAKAYTALGDFTQADRYMACAGELFLYVHETVPEDSQTMLEAAGAIHDLGNMQQARGAFASAIENYKLATLLYPDHCHAWRDMFLSYLELAKQGHVNLDAMRNALDATRATSTKEPGIDAEQLQRFDAIFQEIENALH